MKTSPNRHARALTLITTLGVLALVAMIHPRPAEARRGGFRGRGFAGPRIGFAIPYHGFYGGYSSPYYRGFYGRFGYPYPHGPYRTPEGGINPIQARMMGWGAIDVEVKPGKAEVWVDGQYVATARDLDGHPSYLWLEEGSHRVTIFRGGFTTYDEEISITRGAVIKLKLKLESGVSQPPQPATQTENPDPQA